MGAAQEAAAVGRQTDAVIRSTGGAAGLSARGFADLAKQISKTAAVDDDLVQGGENILATFTNIKASGPEKIFQRAEQAAVDMAAAMGHGEVTAEGLQTANVQLGKALNDPVKGMTALQKVGVTFSAQQKAQIADFVKHGQLAKAQGVILAEVNREFGGSAAAAATGSKRFAAAVGNLQESLGGALLPTMERGAVIGAKLAEGFTDLDQATGGLASKALLGAAGVAGIGVAAGKTVKFLNDSSTAWKALRAAKVANVVADKVVGDAEVALAAKTRIAGDAAAVSGGKFKLLSGLGGVGLVGGILAAFAAVGFGLKKLDDQLRKADLKKQISGLAGDPAALIAARRRLGEVSAQLAGMADGTLPRTFRAEQALREEQRKLNAALAGFANEGTKVTDRTNLLGSQLDRTGGTLTTFSAKVRAATSSYRAQVSADKQLHDQLLSSRDAVLSQADAFEHGRRASAVKTRGVLADLRSEVATLKTWASDAQALIRRGMSPDAVRFLSEKGPQYLRAFASGGDKAIASFERLFKQRMVNSGNVAFNTTAGAAEAFRRMVARANAETARIKAAKARAEGVDAAAREFRRFRAEANAALGGIVNRSVTVKVKSGFSVGPGGGLGGRGGVAGGGLVDGPGTGTSDTAGLFALSRGEVVVPDANVRGVGGPRALAALVGMRRMPVVRGMASGGVVHVGASGDAGPVRRGAADTNAKIDRIVAQAATLIRAAAAAFGAGGSAGIKAFIRATDRLPYRWGAAGPGSYDCSGLVGAVYGKMRGDPRAGHGRRYFTTGSISTRVAGLKPGFGGTLNIGVTPGTGHMAGNYGGLGFEARSTRTGIFTGSAARSVASFARHYHMARGGVVGRPDPREVAALLAFPGIDVGGDAARTRVAFGRLQGFDQGGWLPPGFSLAYNGTGRPERVGGGGDVHVHFHGPVYGGRAALAQLADDVRTELLAKKGRNGRMTLGLA